MIPKPFMWKVDIVRKANACTYLAIGAFFLGEKQVVISEYGENADDAESYLLSGLAHFWRRLGAL